MSRRSNPERGRAASTDDQMHQIGEVAEAVGLSLRTIRYYEEADLALSSGRSTPSGDRDVLLDRLAMFAELAEERCQRLREHVAAGEMISRTLRAELAAEGNSHPRR